MPDDKRETSTSQFSNAIDEAIYGQSAADAKKEEEEKKEAEEKEGK